MSSPETTADGPRTYLNARRGLRSWLLSTDHKRVALLYLASTGTAFVLAATMAVLLRLELIQPGEQYFGSALYNRILTLHGWGMVFLFIVPGAPAIFGNFFLPILIGAEDVAFPRLNLASWYFYMVGALIALCSLAIGGPDTGWTLYVPYSTQGGWAVYLVLLGTFLVGWSSILTGINFVVTVHRLRVKGMGWQKMPLFVWALYSTAWIQILATPVVGILLLLVVAEGLLHIGIFDPTRGGDPLLYQHLFWIYSHPAVYIMILPGMGIVSEIIPTFSRRTIFGYGFIVASSLGIAGVGSLVWAHHMFTSGISDEARIFFSFMTFLVAVPSGVKIFNWLASMYGGAIRLEPPMLMVMMFIWLFTIGGLSGLFLGALSTDIHLHDTSFVVGHFHYVMFGGGALATFAALHYWFPKMFGRMHDRRMAHLSAWLFFIGFNATYFSLKLAGVAGMPRRYSDYLPEFTSYHLVSTVGSWIMVGGLIVMFVNLAVGSRYGAPCGRNPWGGATLEWQTPSPPPVENFDRPPNLERGAYEYPEVVES